MLFKSLRTIALPVALLVCLCKGAASAPVDGNAPSRRQADGLSSCGAIPTVTRNDDFPDICFVDLTGSFVPQQLEYTGDIKFATGNESCARILDQISAYQGACQAGQLNDIVNGFYSIFAPLAETQEVEQVIEYVNSILSQDQETVAARQLDESAQDGDAADRHQKKLRKLVFGAPAAPSQTERSLEERQSGNGLGRWAFDALKHRITPDVVDRLAQAFLFKKFGTYLRADDPRSYCDFGGCISWHHAAVNRWGTFVAYGYADNLVRTARSQGLQSFSAKATLWYLGMEAICFSNRGTGC